MTEMGSAVRFSLLGLLLWLQLGRAPARITRTADQVSEADIQRLLHGVMEQLGIARPRVEYPAHQATNIVGPQSIQGESGVGWGWIYKRYTFKLKCSPFLSYSDLKIQSTVLCFHKCS